MAQESSEKTFLSVSGSGPGVAAWDKTYEQKQDGWSISVINTVVKKEIVEKFTNGEKGLDFFLPLCGRSPDMMCLASQGHRVTGVDWVEQAVKQFFVDNKLAYEMIANVDVGKGKGDLYKAKEVPISIYCCDFFLLNAGKIGKFDCIWDNGSMGSFPNSQLTEYASIICNLMKPKANILSGTFHYDPSLRVKPPLPVPPECIQAMYGAKFDIELVQREGVDAWKSYYQDLEAIIFDPRTFPYFNWHFHLMTPKN